MNKFEQIDWSGESIVHRFGDICFKHYTDRVSEQVLRKYHFAQSHIAKIINTSSATPVLKCRNGKEDMGERKVQFQVLPLPQESISPVTRLDGKHPTVVSTIPFIGGISMRNWWNIANPVFEDSDIDNEVVEIIKRNLIGYNTKFRYLDPDIVNLTVTDMGSSIVHFVKDYEETFGDIKI